MSNLYRKWRILISGSFWVENFCPVGQKFQMKHIFRPRMQKCTDWPTDHCNLETRFKRHLNARYWSLKIKFFCLSQHVLESVKCFLCFSSMYFRTFLCADYPVCLSVCVSFHAISSSFSRIRWQCGWQFWFTSWQLQMKSKLQSLKIKLKVAFAHLLRFANDTWHYFWIVRLIWNVKLNFLVSPFKKRQFGTDFC